MLKEANITIDMYHVIHVTLEFIFRDKKLNYSTFPRAQLGSPDGMGESQTPISKAIIILLYFKENVSSNNFYFIRII